MMTLSYHAKVERAERLAMLEQVLGFTSIVLEVEYEKEDTKHCLTSSGIVIIKNLYTDLVVTAYMANLKQCYKLYRDAGKAQIAPRMYKRVKKNAERHSELFYL